jgi:hypothetical protein
MKAARRRDHALSRVGADLGSAVILSTLAFTFVYLFNKIIIDKIKTKSYTPY